MIVYGNPEQSALDQMFQVMKHQAVGGALMADSHLGYSVPIGGVLAYKGAVCVNGVGFDIACGCKAVRLNRDSASVHQDIYRIMNDIQKHISFGIGRKNKEIVRHELFDDPSWNHIDILHQLRNKAIEQLGTVGAGNHFVDVFIDEISRPWIGVHFGSRGLGHSICTEIIKRAGGKDGVNAKPVILGEHSDLGEQYIKCMEIAGRYAYAGRDWVCSKVAGLLQAEIIEEVHNHHNFAWKEKHFGEDLWVVRKGATPNFPGQRSFVGGSMGDFSYILEGLENEENASIYYSTIHGAGRKLGRTEAKGKTHRKTGEILSPGKVSREEMDDWVKRFDVELRGGDLDESPQAYKRIDEVLHYHRNTVKVIHRLKPIGVCMADPGLIDFPKDNP